LLLSSAHVRVVWYCVHTSHRIKVWMQHTLLDLQSRTKDAVLDYPYTLMRGLMITVQTVQQLLFRVFCILKVANIDSFERLQASELLKVLRIL
jgi:hypothetical protein